jgi:hypothetical protein
MPFVPAPPPVTGKLATAGVAGLWTATHRHQTALLWPIIGAPRTPLSDLTMERFQQAFASLAACSPSQTADPRDGALP